MHERITLNQAINLCKALEPYRLFFLEDPFPPEENDHFRLLRQQTSIPIAMGELFNTQHEYLPLIKDRLIDFIRIHISQIGGLSPARKVAALCEFFGVRTAWHGPGDASPLAHAAQLALELASYNFGVHEGGSFPQETQEVFVGCPEVKNGYMLAQEKPGLGIEVDEKARREVPVPAGSAELRLLVGHDPAERRHGDQTVERQLPTYLFSGSGLRSNISYLYSDRGFGITASCRNAMHRRPGRSRSSRSCVGRTSGCVRICDGRKQSASGSVAKTRN